MKRRTKADRERAEKAALLVLYVQTFRAVPSVQALADELLEVLRRKAG